MSRVIDHPGRHIPVQGADPGPRTLGEVFLNRASATPTAPAAYVKRDEEWHMLTWHQFRDDGAAIARGLIDLGLETGDRVAILGPTHYDWCRFDVGAHLAGLVTVGVYPMQSVEQLRYLLEHSESRVVFVADEAELDTVLQAIADHPRPITVVPWDPALAARHAADEPRIVSPEAFDGPPLDDDELAARQAAVDPASTAILVYTSGTTGPPKAAMISHDNLLSCVRQHEQFHPFFEDDLLISFLPMAHVTERVLNFYLRLNTGVAAAYATSIGAVLGELSEVRPTVFGSVPRIFEKAFDKIQGDVARKPAPVRALFGWAESVAARRLDHVLAGRAIPTSLALQYRLATKLVFAKVHNAFGGRVRSFITGAAPIAPEILHFFWGADLPIFEAYGMTEATVVTHVNRSGAVKLGTVGQVIAPMEAKIADDGEILLRGPFVFRGYDKNEAATRETVVDGWLHSGDIGTIDDDGFLRITDRKKHLIITAGGKNVAPANIERAIKNQSPLISQVHAHGDRRKYISALLAPSPIETLAWGVEHGALGADEAQVLESELLANPSARSEALAAAMARVVARDDFKACFLAPVQAGNLALARVERVRRFVVLDRDFSQEAGELTPTMKMKRKAIESSFAETFDRIYTDPDFSLDAEPG